MEKKEKKKKCNSQGMMDSHESDTQTDLWAWETWSLFFLTLFFYLTEYKFDKFQDSSMCK